MELLRRRIRSGRYAEADKYVDAAVTSANRAAALTARLLAFGRRQSSTSSPWISTPSSPRWLIPRAHDGRGYRARNPAASRSLAAMTDANQVENRLRPGHQRPRCDAEAAS